MIRVPGKDTALLGIDRQAERVANERAARVGIAPPVAAMLDDPQAIVTVFVEGRGLSAAELREPAALAEVARCAARDPRLGEPLPTAFDSFRIVEDYARDRPRARRDAARGLRRGARLRRRDRGGADAAPSTSRCRCHNDLLAANFIRGEPTARRRGQLWIVDWEYAGMGDRYFDLANFAVNNELGEAAEEALLAAYFGEPPTARRLATLRLMRFMSDFREAMWGVVQAAVSELDFDFADYREQPLRPAARDRGRPALPRLAAGGRRCRVAELPDSARCVIIGGGVGGASHRLPPGEARLGRRRPASTAPSSPPARPSTPPAWSASCAARSR